MNDLTNERKKWWFQGGAAHSDLMQPATSPVTSSDRVLTIPNILSFARLAAVPIFVWLFVSDRKNAAVLLYAVAAWTDFLDGYIARHTGSVSELGKVLDPLADRILIAALAIALVAEEALPLWVVLAVVGRDVLVLALYPVAHRGTVRRIRVNFAGKLATSALLAGLTFLAVAETTVSWGDEVGRAGLPVVLFGAVFYWVSGAMYAKQAMTLRGEVES